MVIQIVGFGSQCRRDISLKLLSIYVNHDYKYVKEDFELWREKIKENGILSGHDYSEINDIPYFENGLLTITGTINKKVTIGKINHLFDNISDRLVNEQYLNFGKVECFKIFLNFLL